MGALPAFTFTRPAGKRKPPEAEGVRWLSMRHAACELDISVSTVRRWLQTGKLRSRVVTRGRRKYYYVQMPESTAARSPERVSHIVDHLRRQVDQREEALAERDQELRHQEKQIGNLSRALARAISQNGTPHGEGVSPYEKYRSLARRRRFWIIR
jgi:hypothetical protein